MKIPSRWILSTTSLWQPLGVRVEVATTMTISMTCRPPVGWCMVLPVAWTETRLLLSKWEAAGQSRSTRASWLSRPQSRG
ncbi:hypothetical protein VTN31DRAFT_3432 [Thermomyces dupontii]|uniref:uncharacterized protein n=1 Tax=Talaromyces thermophilus TaxID=28565 RepID=UPI0037422888